MIKTLIVIASLITCSLNLFAGVWTFHAVKDNSVFVEVWDKSSTYPDFHYVCMQWDYDAGVITGGIWSGVWWWDGSGTNGWVETHTVDVPDSWRVDYASISAPYPHWRSGSQEWLEDVESAFPGPGEYWIDYDSTGTKRVSTTAPADFGKWAWDGSINPNYVEPLVLRVKGKSHRK